MASGGTHLMVRQLPDVHMTWNEGRRGENAVEFKLLFRHFRCDRGTTICPMNISPAKLLEAMHAFQRVIEEGCE